jgi:hypothetical protein
MQAHQAIKRKKIKDYKRRTKFYNIIFGNLILE